MRRILQGERVQFNASGYSAVESAMIVYQVIQYPGIRTSADYNHQVVTVAAPSVPKAFKCGQESGTGRVHPRQFIEKHDLLFSIVFLLKMLLKHKECVQP